MFGVARDFLSMIFNTQLHANIVGLTAKHQKFRLASLCVLSSDKNFFKSHCMTSDIA